VQWTTAHVPSALLKFRGATVARATNRDAAGAQRTFVREWGKDEAGLLRRERLRLYFHDASGRRRVRTGAAAGVTARS